MNAEDKFGTPLDEGDTVFFVYGGRTEAAPKKTDPAEEKAREEATSPAPLIKKMQDLAKHDETREKDPSKPLTEDRRLKTEDSKKGTK